MEGHERHPDLTYPDDEFLYYFCAKEFGWTIQETDEQPAPMIDWLVAIHNALGEVQNDKE